MSEDRTEDDGHDVVFPLQPSNRVRYRATRVDPTLTDEGKCWRCHGKGTVPTRAPIYNETCSVCEGTGRG